MFSLGLRHEKNRLFVLDQTKLPHEETWIQCQSPKDMFDCIVELKVRGAPLIGVAAALELARFREDGANNAELVEVAKYLRNARPTAVNLMAAIDRLVLNLDSSEITTAAIVNTAEKIFDEDVALCEAIAKNGEIFINDGDNVLTHCNAGAIATAGIGTSIGIIRKAHENGKKIHVFVDETRPLLQGARLTAWELGKLGIPYTLICDNMAGMLMKQGKIQKIFVGADRIAKNGDFANKIGTYSVAVLAHHHKIPFYVAAPYTTVDQNCATGADIPIEERNPAEVRRDFSPRDCKVYNPAFDVTPRDLVSEIILDSGLYPGLHCTS